MNAQQQRDAERRDAQATLQRLRDREQLLLQLQAATSGGIHREENVELWAHCGNVLTCDDSQVPVVGVRTTTSQTYADNGGDGPTSHMVEKSWTDLEFANEVDKTCKRCGGPTHLSDQERPIYAPLSGHSQRGLVELAKKLIVAGVKPTPEAILASSKPPDDRVATLEKELADIKALIGNGHASEGPANPPAAMTAPRSGIKGYRKRGERYEALIYKSESADGRQHAVGSFDTPEEALAARSAALS